MDVTVTTNIRIISVYRSFRPVMGMTPDEFFSKQLSILESAICDDCYIMGDFNLDAKMELRSDYLSRLPLLLLNEFALNKYLTQVVNFNTWSSNINGVRKDLSALDHVYVNNSASLVILPLVGQPKYS